jgi:ribosomal protein S18 acetylase RimI-like enzyme
LRSLAQIYLLSQDTGMIGATNSSGSYVVKMTLATGADVGRIMSLIRNCIKTMESQGIYQWNEFYPTQEVIRDDIENETLHVLREDGDVLGIIVLNEEQPSEWGKVNWSTREGKVLAVHRLAVNPKWQQKGIGGRLLDFAEEYAVREKYSSIRLDTYSGNPIAICLYEKHGYKRVGQVRFSKRELPFYCYEKTLRRVDESKKQ